MDTAEAPEMCVVNIGPGERRRRIVVGWVGAGISVLAAGALLASGAGRGWRLLAFVPIAVSAVGFFQARAHT